MNGIIITFSKFAFDVERILMKLKLILQTPTIVLLSLFGCGSKFTENHKKTGYDLNKTDATYTLPNILHEVSGITNIDNMSVGFIQDENGVLFIHDALKNEPIKQLEFHINGDYEGIARIESTIYVLRSDGNLFEIKNYDLPDYKLDSIITGIPANKNEGLCYDRLNNRLLIAAKGKISKGPEFKDKRVIYGLDPKTKKLSNEPIFDFDLESIKQFAINNKINLPRRGKKKSSTEETNIKFKISDICIHPITGKLFLLSASEYLLFIFDMNGKIEHIEVLDSGRFNKAEGITFFDNGDMLITNEGQDKKPTLLRFNYLR